MNRQRFNRLRFWWFVVRSGVRQFLDFCFLFLTWLHPRSISATLHEWWALLSTPLGIFHGRRLGAVLAQDARDAAVSGGAFFADAGSSLLNALKLFVRLPIFAVLGLIRLPLLTWWYVRTRTPLQLALGSLLIFSSGIVFAWPAYLAIREMRVESLRRELYRQLNIAFERSSYADAKHNLTVLRNVTPNDDKLASRLAALETGEAPPQDFQLCHLLIRHHVGRNDFKSAAREAEKLIVHEPSNWEARLILADRAWKAGDRDEVNRQLAAMPSAMAANRIELWSALHASRLFRELEENQRVENLLEFMGDRLVPFIRSGDVINVDPIIRCQLIDCYNQVLSQIDLRPTLLSYWVPVQKVCHTVVNSKDVSASVLAYLGTLQEAHVEALAEFRKRQMITEEEHQELLREVEDRLALIWGRVHQLDPNHAMAYLGQATQLCRRKKFPDAIARLRDGLVACGPTTELVATMARVLRDHDPQASIRFLSAALADTHITLPLCGVIVDAAKAAKRPDIVIEACQKARELKEGQVWTYRAEAEALLETNSPTQAAATLRKIPSALATDPASAALYVRALCECGAVELAEQYLDQLFDENQTSSVIAAGANALVRCGHPSLALRHARRAVERDQTSARARVVLADLLNLLARTEEGYDRDLADAALREYRKILFQAPGNLLIIANISWLELKALDRPDQAYETAAPLQKVQNPGLPPELLETLGAIYLARGEYESARMCLEWAINGGGQKPSFLTHLALAYHGLSRFEQAEQCLTRAESQPRTPGENRDIELARRKLRQSLQN